MVFWLSPTDCWSSGPDGLRPRQASVYTFLAAGGRPGPSRSLFGRLCSQIHRIRGSWSAGPVAGRIVKTREDYLRLTLDIARKARAAGNHPFGAILVGPDGAVLMEAGNAHGEAGDRTAHAERVLMTRASQTYSAEFMATCTMYANAEPCAMCAGSAYWAGVGRVVYGLSERDLGALIGPHPENLTMDLPCRVVLGAGQRVVEVVGPLLEEEARAVHEGFWNG